MSRHHDATLADLAVIALTGDQLGLARQRIVRRYLSMVHQQAGRVARLYGVERDDLAQAGVLAIYHAIDRYDAGHPSGATFMGYATWFVRTRCHREARRMLNVASRGVGEAWRRPGDAGDALDHLPDERATAEMVCDAERAIRSLRAQRGRAGTVALAVHLEGRGLTEIAADLGVSKQRVYQLLIEGEAAARDALRDRRAA